MDRGCFGCLHVGFDNERGLYCKNTDCVKMTGEKNESLEMAQKALLKRVTGYDYEETEVTATRDGKTTRVKKVKKHVPPDVTAIALFLKSNFPDLYK